MKTKFFKTISAFLAVLMMFYSTPVFAFSSSTTDTALDFLTSRGFVLGTIESTEVSGEKVIVQEKTDFCDNVTLTYEEKEDGILVEITENDVYNTVFYSSDGIVYLNDAYSPIFNTNNTSTCATYAPSWSQTSPQGATGSYSKYYGRLSSDYNFGSVIRTLTTTAIAAGLTVALGFTAGAAFVFSTVAAMILDNAVKDKLSTSVVSYNGTIYSNTRSTSLQYFYKYNVSYSLNGSVVASHIFYKTDTLC